MYLCVLNCSTFMYPCYLLSLLFAYLSRKHLWFSNLLKNYHKWLLYICYIQILSDIIVSTVLGRYHRIFFQKNSWKSTKNAILGIIKWPLLDIQNNEKEKLTNIKISAELKLKFNKFKFLFFIFIGVLIYKKNIKKKHVVERAIRLPMLTFFSQLKD